VETLAAGFDSPNQWHMNGSIKMPAPTAQQPKHKSVWMLSGLAGYREGSHLDF